MKKSIFLILLLSLSMSLFANNLEEPEPKKSSDLIYFNYGTPSAAGFSIIVADTVIGSFLSAMVQQNLVAHINENTGVFKLGYQHMFNKILGVGFFANYEKMAGFDCFSLVARFRAGYTWSRIGVYANCALGLSVFYSPYANNCFLFPAFDFLTFSLVFFATKHLALTVEAGGVFSSIVSAGVAIKF